MPPCSRSTRDDLFPVEVARTEMAKLARVYEALDAAPRLEHDVFDDGHRWNGERACPFLDHWL